MIGLVSTLVTGAALTAVVAESAPGPSADAALILGEGSYWRVYHVARTPVVRLKKGAALTDAVESGHAGSRGYWRVEGAAPRGGWQAADFDDRAWRRTRSFGNRHGIDRHFITGSLRQPSSTIMYSPALTVQCVRGRFFVPDPGKAKGVRLSIAYRGGVIVYLNGREVTRGHLPKGEVGPNTLAEEYPPEAFEHPRLRGRSEGEGKANLDLRVRTLEVDLPAASLRTGVNVLAFESHRAPFFGSGLRAANMNVKVVWATCGLAEVRLTTAAGVRPNVSRPDGVRVWTCPTTERLDVNAHGDPTEPLAPIDLVGVRNGVFCGQVVVTSAKPVSGVGATKPGSLQRKGGDGAISGDNVTVLYVEPAEYLRADRRWSRRPPEWDTLTADPPGPKASGAIQPIWVRVRVPGDAAPGDYEGQLTVRADGLAPTVVPLRLKVINWELPDPRGFVTHLGLIQSPDSVAMWYKTPAFDDRHWALMEPSFKLLGELGNKAVYLPIIARTNLGNEQSMVRWIAKGRPASPRPSIAKPEAYTPDFAVLERYLDLALKYLKPEVICLYVFDHGSGSGRRWRYRGVKPAWPGMPVTQVDPRTGKMSMIYAPRLDAPEARTFWGPVFRGIRERLKARGVLGAAMVGIENDHSFPTKEITALMKDLMPGAPWVVQTHPGDRAWGDRPGYFTKVYIRSYSTAFSWKPETYRTKWLTHDHVAWRRVGKQGWFLRGFGTGGGDLMATRTVPERAFMHNCSGWGRIGADFWPLGQPTVNGKRPGGYAKNTSSIAARYPETDWFQLNLERGGPESLIAPGPKGALPTVRFEAVRQGVQEAEARISTENALIDPKQRAKLGDDLANRCDAVLTERIWALKSGAGDMEKLAERLYATAAQVADKLRR